MVCSSTPTVGISSATVTSEAVSRSLAPSSFSQISGMPVATTHMVPTSSNHLVTSDAPLRMTNESICLPPTSGLRTNVQGLACISKPSPSIILPLDLSTASGTYQDQPLDLHVSTETTSMSPNQSEPTRCLDLQVTVQPDAKEARPPLSNDNDRESLSADSPALQQDEDDDDEEENIMPQLMGEKINCLSPRGDDLRVIHVKEVEVRGPVNEAALNALQETIKHENQHVREEMDKNTRAVRCLEKAVREQTETMHLQTQVLNEIKAEMHQFILYYRGCAREERRKEEERQRETAAPQKRKRDDSPDRKENVSTIKSVVKKVPLARRNAKN